ncbi:hypothetical protein KY330_03875 [Candidatus Woesearchaeota archaeon]|nr:hypothetical protein [Candidatus Woesearchaeota archaeon]
MNKRGQITIFLIIGILIVVLLALFFIVRDKEITPEFDTAQIKSFTETCLNKVSKDGLYFISLQGGYYDTPEPNRAYSYIKIPYYWDGTAHVPTKETIERELEKYIDNELPECIDGFNTFTQQGYSFQLQEPMSDVMILASTIDIKLSLPVKITKDESIVKLNHFTSALAFDFNNVYDLVTRIVDEQKKTPDSIPLGFITDLAYNNDFTFETMNLEHNVVLYALIFKEDYVYTFFAKYDWPDIVQKSHVTIEPIEELTITEPKIITILVNALGTDLTFSDYSNYFDINPTTGVIEFYSADIPNGDYNFLIKAKDNNGNEDLAILTVKVDIAR